MDIYSTRQQLRTRTIYDIPMRVTFYARVSTDSDEQLNSLENQTQYYNDYIRKNPNWIPVSGYIDEGLSAATTKKRENFNQMITDARLGKFDFIITKELTRFARNTLDSIRFTRELLSYGVCVLFQGDNINTIDEDSELRLTIMAGIAQDELRKLSSRIKFGHQQAIKKGVVLGNGNIFGYRKADKRLYIDEEEAEMVRQVFELYATGNYSMRQIEIHLYDQGYRNRNGKKIMHNTLSNMISNPKYKGYYAGNKVKVMDFFTKKQKFLPKEDWVVFKDETGEIVPAIVSEEIWEKANAVLKKRSDEVKTRKLKCNHPNLLTGKLLCSCCNQPYYRKDAKYKNHVTSRWVCSGKLKNGASYCPSFALEEEEMREIIFDVFTSTYEDTDRYIDEFMEFYQSVVQQGSTRNVQEYKQKIALLEAKKEKLLTFNVEGKISDSDFFKMYKKCEDDLNALREHEQETLEADKVLAEVGKELRLMKSQLKKASETPNVDMAFVNEYIKQIIVTPISNHEANLEIQLFTNESLQRNLVRIGKTSKKICLSSDIEQNILPMMYDIDMAVREIYNLVVYDTTISDGVKQKLTAGYPFSNSKEKADFLCAVLCFSMERNFIKREPEKSSLKDYGALSPFVKNLIYGAEVPKPCRYFCDRAGEQSELHFMLSEYGKVFLQGIPGIGKSELAKAYAQSFKKEYTNIIYINYSGSLKNDIIKLDFAEDYNANEPEADRFRRHDRFLRSLKDDSLIIIDNFNTVASDDETLSTVLAYSCRILFTTRSRFDEYNDTYTVEEMPDDELLGLMGSLYSEADNHSEILREIIHTVHNHTFAVELSARLLEVGILAPNQLLEKLRAEKAAMDSEDKISVKKDGKSKKATYYKHIHTLFSLYKLSKTESEVMRNLALAPHNGVNVKLFALWLELKNMNAINDLIESGFVKELPGRMIALHPMIQEIALDEMKPSVVNCSIFLQSLQTICMCHGNDVLYYKQLFEMIDSIVDLIDNDDMKTYLLFLEDVFPYCEKYENHHLMQKVTDILSSLLKDSNVGADKDRALLYDYLAIVADDPLVSIQYEERAISTIKKVHSGNIVLVCNLYTNLSHFYHMSGNIKSALDNMGTALQLAKKFKIENHHDNLVRRRNYATFLVAAGQPLYALAELMKLSEVIEYHYSNQSLDYAMVQEDMGKIFCCLGKKEQASKHFKYAFHLYKIHFQSEPERIEAKKQEMIMYLSMEKLM